MVNKRRKNYIFSMLILLLSMGSVNAALVGFTAEGTVGTADPGNIFGLNTSTSNTIFASGVFDDAVFSTSGNLTSYTTTLSLDVGTQDFTEADALGVTEIVFQDDAFLGFNFFTDFGSTAFFDSTFDFFNGEDDDFNYIDGSWNVASYSVSAVPVPAAAWLFGSGLLALVGFFRRKK